MLDYLVFPFIGIMLFKDPYKAYLIIALQVIPLSYFAAAFLLGAKQHYRICVGMVCSLFMAVIAFYLFAVVGDLVCVYVVSKFQRWALLPSSETIGWLTLLRVSALSIVVGLCVFIFSFRRTLRLLNDSIELDLKLMAYFGRPAVRLMLIVASAACIAGIGGIAYVRTSCLHSSETLAQRLVQSNDDQLLRGATRELVRRGPSAVPPIVAAIEAIAEQDKKHRQWGDNRSRPGVVYLFHVLAQIKTEESRQELYKWVERRDCAPWYRYTAAEMLARNHDIGWIPLAEDMFGALNGQRYMLPLFLPHADKQELLAAMPYIRTVAKEKLISKEDEYGTSTTCVSILARIDSDESRELLARIAHYSDSCKKETAKVIGEERLAELLKKYPKREP